ncbi:AIPR family protein [Deinococcus radiopugnans]|uniref:AIPR family protein n=1 Tax=Deinococcus radiopugnans TaxID=57497 RepID=UPI00068E6289|nr:AIPR family protein [Deinococcus radiopugnans]
MSTDLNAFAASIQDDISARAASAPAGHASQVDLLTSIFIDDLSESGEIENGEVAHYQNGTMHVSGYGLSDAGDRLDLFVTMYRGALPPQSVPQAEVDRRLRRLLNFLKRALDSASPLAATVVGVPAARDMAMHILEHRTTITRVRLHLFTDGLVKDRLFDSLTLGGVKVSQHVWDIQRLYRNQSHRQQPEPIVVDLQGTFGMSLPCLVMPASGQDYSACLTIFPGTMLAQIYREYGPRLLERNVRSFLQASGGINRGIRQTILKEPGRFLAYNNGISATASHIEYVDLPGGQRAIGRIHDFQIVNGGQTTASLHRVMARKEGDLGQVHVQAKISIVDHGQMTEMVPLISRYANSQNKIEEADLAANDTFHVRLEQESKKTWTPAPAGAQQTHWFYERARGQYRDAEAQQTTPARRRAFQRENPKEQKFVKVDVARFINIWDGQPEVVSRGNQKNFAAFTVRMTGMGGARVNRELFQRLVGLSLLFREANTLARQYQAYRVYIIAYTIAWMVHHTGQRLNLDLLWREQRVPAELIDVMRTIMAAVQEQIVTEPAGANVTEWCKREDARKHVLGLAIAGVEALDQYTVKDPIHLLEPLPPEEEPPVTLEEAPADDQESSEVLASVG